MKNKEYALIVAGGKGSRMKTPVPKQFLEVNGLPILMHTLDAFFRYSKEINVILVLPENDFNIWADLCKKFQYNKPVVLQKGGDSRFQSVKNGLDKIEGEGLVAIHDGVRPLVHVDMIRDSFLQAALRGSAVAAVPLKESIRMLDGEESKALDRSQFKLIQTPQTFDVTLIKSAYQIEEDPTLTDDASVVERSGRTISLFEGRYDNIKVTTSEDIIVVSALLANLNNATN
jgi:2-C-methyl-D-erythritol 4-phosphate cytidylyltransferase